LNEQGNHNCNGHNNEEVNFPHLHLVLLLLLLPPKHWLIKALSDDVDGGIAFATDVVVG
jgi:hypothetical protein